MAYLIIGWATLQGLPKLIARETNAGGADPMR
jgi:hypothetical protein